MKATKNKTAQAKTNVVNLGMLLVVISGAYAVYVVVLGTDGVEPKVMVAPLAAWLSLKLIQQFSK